MIIAVRNALLFFFLLYISEIAAATPEWVKKLGNSSQFPSSRFITGFGVSDDKRTRGFAIKIEQASRAAKADLLDKIRIRISTVQEGSVFTRLNKSGVSIYTDEFRSKIASSSSVDLEGMGSDLYFDKGSMQVFALVWLDKAALLSRYLNSCDRLSRQLRQLYGNAVSDISEGDTAQALVLLDQCDILLRELTDILGAIGLFDPASIPPSTVDLILNVRNCMAETGRSGTDSIDKLAEQLIVKLPDELENAGGTVLITAPVFEKSGKFSLFSLRVLVELERQIPALTRFEPVLAADAEQFPSGANPALYSARRLHADFLVTSAYFMTPSGVRVLLSVNSVSSNRTVTVTEALLNKTAVCDSLFVLKDQGNLTGAGESAGDTQLHIQAYTSRGAGNQVLQNGDEFTITVRVDKPCFLRFVVSLPDGPLILPDAIYANYQIDGSRVNAPFTLPDTFVVTAPFGRETLDFYVSTRPFPELHPTHAEIAGVSYLSIGSDPLMQSRIYRGLARKKNGPEMAEHHITITTVNSP